MPGTGPRAKHWCFTMMNSTPADVDRLSAGIDGAAYMIIGKEVSESGIPQLQGQVSFTDRKRLSQVLALIGQCHCSVTRYLHRSIEYCKKDGDYIEVGVQPRKEGSTKKEIKNDYIGVIRDKLKELERLIIEEHDRNNL